MQKFVYLLFYKPYGILCQFSTEGEKTTLKKYFPNLQTDVYPVGRLDEDSEGLLLLTNDKHVNQLLWTTPSPHLRTYWVQVEGSVTTEATEKMRRGIEISIKGKHYQTLPCHTEILTIEPALPDRIPPIRYRKQIPTSWISISLREGKNRQVRRMTAAVGFPTLRLVRVQIGSLHLGSMQPGEVRILTREQVYSLASDSH